MIIGSRSFKNRIDKRSFLLIKNVVASFAIKGWSALVVLLMVPLTLKILGIYNNGVWLTISSILIWIDWMDIGLGNGLRNAVSHFVAIGDNENVRKAVSSTFFMLVVVVIPFLLILYAVIWNFDMYMALGVDAVKTENLNTILTIALTLSSMTFILKATGSFYMGLQLPAVNNLIVCLGHTLALLLTFILYMLEIHSLLMVVIVNTASLLVTWAVFFPYTFKKRYPQYSPSFKHINLNLARKLCSTGVQFFVIQICGVLLFLTTNILISKWFSPTEVTPYQVAYRYFNIAFVVFSTICIPFWNATTDAFSKHDFQWIHKASHKLDLVMMGVFLLLTVMVLVSGIVYSIWIGDDVQVPFDLSLCTAAYVFILCFSQRYSYILNGLNVLRIQLIFIIAATITFYPLAWYVCKTVGTVTSLVCVMCVVNIPGLLANMWKYYKLFPNKNSMDGEEYSANDR